MKMDEQTIFEYYTFYYIIGKVCKNNIITITWYKVACKEPLNCM